jgi:hypothetical protein
VAGRTRIASFVIDVRPIAVRTERPADAVEIGDVLQNAVSTRPAA